MSIPKEALVSQKAIAKMLENITQYTPPANLAYEAYAGNPLEQGELTGTIDTSLREIDLVYLQVPEKHYMITLSIDHFPILRDILDGTTVKAIVNEFGFVSNITAA